MVDIVEKIFKYIREEIELCYNANRFPSQPIENKRVKIALSRVRSDCTALFHKYFLRKESFQSYP